MPEEHRGDLHGGWSMLGSRRKGLIILDLLGHKDHSGFYSKSVRIGGRVYVWE